MSRRASLNLAPRYVPPLPPNDPPAFVPPLPVNSPPPPPPPPPPPVPVPTTVCNPRVSTSSSLTTKPSRLHCGWLQINKLYTPYVSSSANNHHLHKIPVSLLTFYGMLKHSVAETSDASDSKESVFPFEQLLATPEEIELLNQLCRKQNIKALALDTKLIPLQTFYEHCSANILFVKDLLSEDPKATICRDWFSIVQISGGICRLRNTTSLQEQTVPFIGKNLLKNFALSSKSMASASFSSPSADETEFLQLILFFSNLSINLRQAQMIDIESVQKEYNVDLILLFNDKFPLNVLNYQQQGYRSSVSQAPVVSSNSSAPTSTIAESTPPPSPPSPPTGPPSSASSTPPPSTPSTNRYHKTIEFRGHSLTAYICSGLGSNNQRECVSIKSLCNILYPDALSTDKLELKMLRLLRSKSINRFRPQNQQSMGFTRLIDVRDADTYWDHIEQGMRSVLTNADDTSVKMDADKPPAVDTAVCVKRTLDEPVDEEDVPVLERIHKRIRLAEKENAAQANEMPMKVNAAVTKPVRVKSGGKRVPPACRRKKDTVAAWTRKYNLEECCVLVDRFDMMALPERA